jgi:HSF-type DNA-binding
LYGFAWAARWFRQTRYTSFQRQLNLYRFTRIASGPDKNGYHHPYFLRGREDLTHRIPRLPRNGNGARGPDTEVPEPNFYRMAPITNETVVPLPISSNTNNDDSNNVVTRPAASTVTQQPRQSSTLHQVNHPFLDNVLPSRINHVLSDNAIVNLDLASTYLPGRLTTASNPMTRTDSSILDRLLSSPSPLNLSAASAVNPMFQQLHRQNARNVISYPSLDDVTMATYILSQQMPERNRMIFHPQQPTIDLTSLINPLVPGDDAVQPLSFAATHSDAFILERWMARQQDQASALALLQQLRQL